MGLLDELTNKEERREYCRLREILEELPEEEAAAVEDAVEKIRTDERLSRSKVYSNQWLSDVLTNNGYKVSRSTVSRHVSRSCSCEWSTK